MTRDDADLTEEMEVPAIAAPEDLEDLALGDDYALEAEYVELVIDAADRGDDERLRIAELDKLLAEHKAKKAG